MNWSYTSGSYDQALYDRVQEKKALLDNRRPLPATAVSRLKEELRLYHTYNSNAIEGSTLSLKETKLIVEEGITIGGKPLREHLEAVGNSKAFELIENLANSHSGIDHEIVQELHSLVSMGQQVDSGRYRTANVRITGAGFTPPDFSKIVPLMDQCMEKVNKGHNDPILTAAMCHHWFVIIHPFSDGNGRVARLISNLYLMQHGYPPLVMRKDRRKQYYECLRQADSGALDLLIDFILRAEDESLSLFLSVFGGDDQLIPLKQLALRSSYSQEYLSLRARQGRLEAVKLDNVWHSSLSALNRYNDRYSRPRPEKQLH